MSILTITIDTPYSDIPDEVKQATFDIVEGWYQNGPINWEDVWDRLDDIELQNGRRLDIRTLTGPAITGLKNYVRSCRTSL